MSNVVLYPEIDTKQFQNGGMATILEAGGTRA